MTVTFEQSRADELTRLQVAVADLAQALDLEEMNRADTAAERRIHAAYDDNLVSDAEFRQWLDSLDRARAAWQRSH